MIGGGLEANHDEIAGTDFTRRASAQGLNVKAFLDALDADAVLADGVIIRPEQEMRFVSGLAELCSVKTAQSAAAHDGNFHMKKKALRINRSALVKQKKLSRAEDGVLGRFGHAELDHLAGRNLDGLAGGGIAAGAGLAVLQDQFPNAGQRKGVFSVLVSQGGEVLENFRARLFGQSAFACQFGSQL